MRNPEPFNPFIASCIRPDVAYGECGGLTPRDVVKFTRVKQLVAGMIFPSSNSPFWGQILFYEDLEGAFQFGYPNRSIRIEGTRLLVPVVSLDTLGHGRLPKDAMWAPWTREALLLLHAVLTCSEKTVRAIITRESRGLLTRALRKFRQQDLTALG